MTTKSIEACMKCGGPLTKEGTCSVCGQTNRDDSTGQYGQRPTVPVGEPPPGSPEGSTPRAPSRPIGSASAPSITVRPGRARTDGSVYLMNEATGESFPLTHSVTKIGRDPTNHISITDDHYISRHHAWILQDQNDYFVEDLGSTNGTLLNGESLKERRQVHSGDRITFGKLELVFYAP